MFIFYIFIIYLVLLISQGHTGIADSEGCIYDFAGPYTIGVGKLAFSSPAKYVQLDPAKCTQKDWNTGIAGGCDMYRGRMHNICCDNCHSHVAKCLNLMGYGMSFTSLTYVRRHVYEQPIY
ncbi:DUF778 domain-containing protein [archaeon]|nr:MAG: DUF778 domain-containing protein [archaeon]